MIRRVAVHFTSGIAPVQYRALATTAILLGNKGGTPKKKNSHLAISKKYYGTAWKEHHMKQTDWYYCPLCSEPKKEDEWCRREDCRQIKP